MSKEKGHLEEKHLRILNKIPFFLEHHFYFKKKNNLANKLWFFKLKYLADTLKKKGEFIPLRKLIINICAHDTI